MFLTDDPNLPMDKWKTSTISGDDPRIIFNRGDLEPETPYFFKIAALGPHGQGVSSDIITFETVSGGKPFNNSWRNYSLYIFL